MKSKLDKYSVSVKWIFVLVSFIPGSGILIIQSLNNSQSIDLLFLFFQSAIAVAFGIVFFVPLWRRMDLKYEGEFILERYSGKPAIILHRFRSGFLYFVVIPLLIALQLSSIQVINGFSIESQDLPYAVGFLIIVVGVVGYSFRRMIYFESFVALLTLVAALFYVINHSENSIPSTFSFAESISWSGVVPPLLVFWWFAGIVDMPDMRAQKLLSLGGQRFSGWITAVPFLLVFSIQGVFLAFPLTGSADAHAEIFLVLFSNILVLVLSLMHWSAHLFEQCFAKNNLPRIAMVFCVSLAMVWVYFGQTTQAIFSQILLMTAGVGPVYLLRWFWPRINAWTQFSAMIGAIVIPTVYRWCAIDSTPYEMLFHVGLINCTIWISVMALTVNRTEMELARAFIQKLDARKEILAWRNWIYFLLLCFIFCLVICGLSILVQSD